MTVASRHSGGNLRGAGCGGLPDFRALAAATAAATHGGTGSHPPPALSIWDDRSVTAGEIDESAPPAASNRSRWSTGAGAAVFVAALIGAAHAGRPAMVAVWLLAQIAFPLGWTHVLDVASPRGVAAIAFAAGAAADGLVLSRDRPLLGGFAALLAITFLASLLHQLVRRHRDRVTEALAATLALAVLDVTGAVYVALRGTAHGISATTTALIGVLVALVVTRLVDAVAPRPSVDAARRRGVAGLVLAPLAGAAVGAALGPGGAATGVALAGVAALFAMAADLGVDLGFATLAVAPSRPRWSAAARAAVAVILPIMVTAAPAYVVARLALN